MIIPLATYNYHHFISEHSVKINECLVLFEGQITNRESLKKRLEFEGDEAVLIERAYKKWGATFVNQLEGSFFITLLDAAKKTVLVYRDRFGILPCYYHRTDHFFACSTQLKQLLELPSISPKLNQLAVGDYLSYGFVHAPQTLVQGIAQLLPGHYLRLTDDEVTVQPYWSATDQYDYTIDERTEEQQAFHINRISEELPPIQIAAEAGAFNCSSSELLNAIPSIDHPTAHSLGYFAALNQHTTNTTDLGSVIGHSVLWGEGALYETLESFQDHRWLLSYPKSLRKLISKLLKIPHKSALEATYQQLIIQDYYDLDYLYPTYKRLYPIAPLQKSIGNTLVDTAKQIAQASVVFQTPGFVYPYLAKVGLMELQTTVANSQLSSIYQASKVVGKKVRFPFLDQKLQRYLLHLPDKQKVNLRPQYKLEVDAEVSAHLLVNTLEESTKVNLFHKFQQRPFVKGQLKEDLQQNFNRLTLAKRTQLQESILLLELWLTENKVDE